jgi:hypothetical protein
MNNDADLKALARADRKEREHEIKRQEWINERRRLFRSKRRAKRRDRQKALQYHLEESLGS